MNDTILWQIRHFVYRHFADTTHAPNVNDVARHFNISNEEVSDYYKELNNRHQFFLDPGTMNIRMAWPFSAIPTDFKVRANGKTYYANCAWDMLGIPVILQSDATAEAICTESNDAVQLEIKNEKITSVVILPAHVRQARVSRDSGEGSLPLKSETLRSQEPLPQSDMLLIHFPIPFTHWYDDLVFT